MVERFPLVERYWERRYLVGPGPYPYRYPNYPGGYVGAYPTYPGAWGSPRPHLGFGGVQYPPAPISYEYDARPRYEYETPRPTYEYGAQRPQYEYDAQRAPYEYDAQRAPYEYDALRRPSLGAPGGYRSAGYIE